MLQTIDKSCRFVIAVFVQALGGIALASLLCGCWTWGGSSYAKHHSVYGSVELIAHRDAFASLHKGDLVTARRILEAKSKSWPDDPEVNYNLGCIDLMESDHVLDRRSKRTLQIRGWSRVESASGKFYPADSLLAHAYLVGRWGKPRNHDLYVKHLHLCTEGYRAQGAGANESQLIKRTWVLLSPP